MLKWLKRFIGFCVTGFVLGLIGWGSVQLYQHMYRGDPHYVVMPEGAAGVQSGSSVYYEGMEVGEVTGTEALLHSNPDTRREANSAYVRKYDLLQKIEGLTPQKRNPHRKALVEFLLREPSIPVGSSTYATGSAFYVTGQGYITLKNRGLTARTSADPVYIPSNVKAPWLEQYVNLGLAAAPFLDTVSSFHTRLANWYHAPQSPARQSSTPSGRSKINAIPTSIDTLQSQTDSVRAGMDTLGTTIGNWNRNMKTTLDAVPGSLLTDPDVSGPDSTRLTNEINTVGQWFEPSSRASIHSVEHSMDGLNRSLQSANRAFDTAHIDFLRNGILD